MKKLLPLIFALNLAILVFAPKTIANTGISISPPTIELLIAPNKNVVQNISLHNLGEAASYRVSLHRLIPLGEDGGSTIDLNPLDPATVPFVFTFPTSLNLQANESTSFTFTIAAASTDKSQAFSLALGFASEQSQASPNSTSTQPIIVLPLLLTLSPDGALDLSLTLENFELPVIADSMLPFDINPKVFNRSSFMHRPGGELVITSPRGVKNNYPVVPSLVLGQTTRRLRFDPVPTLSPSISRFGPHTFAFTLTTPSGKTILTSERIVWFLPLRLILAILSLALIIFAVYLKKSRDQHYAH
ncbi:MAG: hypothetical protein WCL07_01140 [bacterium]